MRYMIWSVILCSFFLVKASLAEKMMWHEGKVSKYFDSVPAGELLTAPEYRAYRKLINQMDCGPAALLLNKAFVKRYPQFSDAAAPRGPEFMRWFVFYVSREFPDLDFCMDSLELKYHEMMLAQDGTNIGRFFTGDMHKPPLLYRREWRERDTSILSILTRAARDHIPAILEIAKLAKRGDVFDIGADFEYYLIKRACHLGAPYATYEMRLKELEKLVSPEKIKLATQMARQKNVVLEIIYGKKSQ